MILKIDLFGQAFTFNEMKPENRRIKR